MRRKVLLYLVTVVLVAGGSVFAVGYTMQRYEARAPRVVSRSLNPDGRGSLTVLSATYTLDRIYRSMTGPSGPHRGLTLLETPEPELVWVTGVRSDVVGPDGETAKSPEFFCHANLTLDPSRSSPDVHNDLFDDRTNLDWRLFTLVPGRMEITLPDGFGIPLYSNEPLDYFTMTLNQNVPDRTEQVRLRTRIDFVRGETAPVTPLFRRAVYGWEPVLDEGELPPCHRGSHPGESCGRFLGETASGSGTDPLGEGRTIHWYVAPGTYEAVTSVTEQMTIPFDTTVHYVTAHLHPFGKKVVFRDVTADEALFEIHSRDFSHILGVELMGEASFPEGVPVYRDHAYELITIYDNTSSEKIDAMSILYLYMHDKRYGGLESRGCRLSAVSPRRATGS